MVTIKCRLRRWCWVMRGVRQPVVGLWRERRRGLGQRGLGRRRVSQARVGAARYRPWHWVPASRPGRRKHLVVRRKHLVVRRKHLVVRRKHLVVRRKHLVGRRKHLVIPAGKPESSAMEGSAAVIQGARAEHSPTVPGLGPGFPAGTTEVASSPLPDSRPL